MKNKITNQIWTQLARGVNRAWVTRLAALALLGLALLAQAAIRLEVTGPPFYARIGYGEVYTDGVWAAIAFYRNPDCVPEDFNLLEFFNPAAFDCESYVAGFEIWKNGPEVDPTPIQSRLNNIAPMPIWFVSWTELQAAIADNELTINELAGLESLLVGWATSFKETLHAYPGSQQSMISTVASGLLEDGRTFSYQATGTEGAQKPGFSHLKIVFK
jgi:hypothetical protein